MTEISKEDFLYLYGLLKPLENLDHDRAVKAILEAWEMIFGETPEYHTEDSVACIGNIHSGLLMLSDGILDGVIEENGVIYTADAGEPVN